MAAENEEKTYTEDEAEAYINQKVAEGMEQLKSSTPSRTVDEFQSLRQELAGLRADLQADRDRAAAEVEAKRLTSEKIEKMTPAQINANWDEVQKVLRSGGPDLPDGEVTKEHLARMTPNEINQLPKESLEKALQA